MATEDWRPTGFNVEADEMILKLACSKMQMQYDMGVSVRSNIDFQVNVVNC